MNLPTFEFEKRLWDKGIQFVAGADEVGRGCFAGPVIASTVAFAPSTIYDLKFSIDDKEVLINDSKRLSSNQRMVADAWIRENALTWGIGSASVAEINAVGIGKATHKAFRRAVKASERNLDKRIEFLLIDAFFVPRLHGFPIGKKRKNNIPDLFDESSRQLAIKRGDSKSLSIAAASIIAKVYRDELMKKLGKREKYQKYDWMSNKGYGSQKHREAILRNGITKHHRIQFVETFLKKANGMSKEQ